MDNKMNGEGFKTGNEETDIANIDNTMKEFFYKVDLRKGLIAGEEHWVKGKICLSASINNIFFSSVCFFSLNLLSLG